MEFYYLLYISTYIGIGHMQLTKLSASIEVPSITSTSYLKNISNISNVAQDTAIEEMIKAGDEKRKIALENGNVYENGVNKCTVIADGQWSKKSNKTNLNAFSGCNIIYVIFHVH